jgi:septal ring factor EnvC (AmiA/AmiB activator)
LACIIAILLVVGGVELNPGPPSSKQLDEIVQRLEDLSRDVRDSRTALTTKFDDMVHDLTTKLNSVELKMATYAQRLNAVEAAQADFTAKLAALEARTITPATGATYAAGLSSADSLPS